jgi:hypothetical protein
MPGTDPAEAMRVVFGELPEFPYLAELPARGTGADMIGRTAALLVDLPLETTPRGWRLAERPGGDLRRAQSLMSRDLDTLEELAEDHEGVLKVQVCGPWTLAASMELFRSQEPVLTDRGAVADLTASLAEGVAAHVSDVARRVTGARIVLQLDEPTLPSVLAGGIPSASGWRRIDPVEASDAESGLRAVLAAANTPTVVHCCAVSVPLGIIRDAGADAVGLDPSKLRRGEEEALAETVEAGMGILAGAVPAQPQTPSPAQRTSSPQPPSPRAVASELVELWRRMGWPTSRKGGPAGTASAISAQVVLTPACGLAGTSPAYARAALACCRDAAALLPELVEEELP